MLTEKPRPTECNLCDNSLEEDHWVWEKDKRYRHGGKWRCRYRKVKDQAAYRARRKERGFDRTPASERERRFGLVRAYKRTDRLKGMETSPRDKLTGMMNIACIYCGSKYRIGLDRIDNTKGHTRENCRPCCGNCNLILIDMPFQMKMLLAPGLRKAREMGIEWKHPKLRRLA